MVALQRTRFGCTLVGAGTRVALPTHCPTPVDSRRLPVTSGENGSTHFLFCLAALARKVAYRLKVCQTLLEGFESLPLRKTYENIAHWGVRVRQGDAGGIRTVLTCRRDATLVELRRGGSKPATR